MTITGGRFVFGAVVTALMAASAPAQWLDRPTAGIPRTPDGKPNLEAPTPRTADGKPEIAGLWKPQPGIVGDIARNLKPGDVPFQPWAEALYKQRRANDTPSAVGKATRFVVQTSGFNDKGWLDNAGKPATEKLHVTERFIRKNFGHMDIQITIDDPKAYTKPWTATQPLSIKPTLSSSNTSATKTTSTSTSSTISGSSTARPGRA